MPEGKPRLIGVCGGSGSGKTTLVERLRRRVVDGASSTKSADGANQSIMVLALDHYYLDLAHLPTSERDQRNFDHPDAFDAQLLLSQVETLAAGRPIDRPSYDFASHTRVGAPVRVRPEPVIVLDGILTLHWPQLRHLLDLAIYVDVDDDVRFIRRLTRDISQRGRTVDSVVTQYLATVKVMHDTYVAPQREVADIVVGWMEYNDRAVEMLASMVRSWCDTAKRGVECGA